MKEQNQIVELGTATELTQGHYGSITESMTEWRPRP